MEPVSEKPKKRGKPKKISTASTDIKPFIAIDHPTPGEKISPHHYAVRLGVIGGTDVEVSIDEEGWKHCRHSSGYYWYDWHSVPAGKHKILARMKLADGTYKKSKTVQCEAI